MPGFQGVRIHVVAIATIGSGMLQQAVLSGVQGTAEKLAWCKRLPRPEYARLKRVQGMRERFSSIQVSADQKTAEDERLILEATQDLSDGNTFHV